MKFFKRKIVSKEMYEITNLEILNYVCSQTLKWTTSLILYSYKYEIYM